MSTDAGSLGEALALLHLERLGYTIVARNYRRPFGEIDIVARDKETLVFVEVKTRHHRKAHHHQNAQYGTPFEAVDHRKQARLARTALDYLAQHNLLEVPARFDVVAVYLNERNQATAIELIQNAFECADPASG